MSAKSADITSGTTSTKMAKSPVFFWLCGSCILTFTLGLDAEGQLTLQRISDGERVTIFDGRPLDQAG